MLDGGKFELVLCKRQKGDRYKKALSLLLAAILAAACFATVGAAADAAVTLNNTDYPGVKVLDTNLDLSVLTDGDKGESLKGIAWADTDKTKIIAFQNENCAVKDSTTTLCLVLDLGAEKTLDSITVTFYKEYNVMIGLGVENTMIVSSSKDGKTFDKLGEYDFTAEPSRDTDGIKANPAAIGALQDETFAFDKPVTARYFELRIHYEFNYENATDGKDIWEFIGMTEITANEADAADVSEPAASAETPAASSAPADDSSKTPVTGDAGAAALVVIAAAALAGALLLRRRRA